MSDAISFGSWLKQRRRELGVAQEELADHAGCSAAMLRKIESGERHPSGPVAQLLADYLHIPGGEREAFIAFARTGKISSASSSFSAPASVTNGRSSSVSHSPWRPPSRTGWQIRTNLPAAITSLIGRESDEERAAGYLLNPQVRLLTLTGAPGIGKTRLALQVASKLASKGVEQFEDGIFLVELASLVDPDAVLPTIAQALGLKESGGQGVTELLAEYLQELRLLLLLDNFEQILDAAPAIVKLLERSPQVKALVTSREPLHVRGEHRFPVPPLGLPELSLYAGPAESLGLHSQPVVDIEALSLCPSVELFVERARAVSPDFELSVDNAQDIGEVCTRLEGLPLAIELAAARADHLSPHDMRAALNSRLKLLTGGARDLPTRQRTLKSAIEWSYELLDEAEQKVFRRLSIFAGGCTLEGAETVCNAPGDLGAGIDIPGVVLELVDKHLVRKLAVGGVTVADGEGNVREVGVARLGLLEMIREYALEKLWESSEIGTDDARGGEERDEREAVERAYALYFIAFAEEATSRMHGTEGAIWVDRLETEHDNVRATLRWLLDTGRGNAELTRLALRLASAMGPFWRSRGYFKEGQEWLSQVLTNAGSIEWDAADEERKSLQAQALNATGWLAWSRGDLTAARQFFDSGLELYRELRDRHGIALLLNGLGQLALDRLNYEEAITAYQEALAYARHVSDTSLTARTLNNLGNVYRNMTDSEAARRCYEESLGLYRAMQDTSTMITPLNNLGLVSSDLEDYAAAHRYYEEALYLCRQIGNKEDLAFTLAFVGMLAVEEADFDMARGVYAEALPLVRDLGYKLVLALCFEGTALMRHKLGLPLAAAKLWGRAAAIRDEMELPLPIPSRKRYEGSVNSARSQTDPSLFDIAWADGRATPIEEAVRFALETQQI